MMSFDCPHPVSRTYQYKKVTKPLLERKRRARINRCLDELKDLMVDALETEGEDISKLEKADILELTVRHLQRLHASRSNGLSSVISKNEEVSSENRWLSGFGHCASEACRFLSTVPGETAEKLARHLATGLQTNRQTNSPTNTNTLPSIFDNFDHVANLKTPCTANPAVEVQKSFSPRTPTEEQSSSSESQLGEPSKTSKDTGCHSDVKIYREPVSSIFKMKKSRDRYSNPVKNKTNLLNVTVEDDEEIDVERIDEADPMWRPW